jgi:hypothetical protein
VNGPTCPVVIDLQKPARSGWEGQGSARRYLFHYVCSCGAQKTVRASSFRGKEPVPSLGGVTCGATVEVPHGQ